MAGEAQSDNFMLGTATIMLGAQADLMNLSVSQSIGLVKDVTFKSTPGFVDLTQGVKNTIVYSVMNKNDVGVEASMFEYTYSNLMYAASLSGASLTAASANSTVAVALSAPTPPALTSAVVTLGSGSGFAVGDYHLISVNAQDQVIARSLSSLSGSIATYGSGLPVGVAIGAAVRKANIVAVGSTDDAVYLSCKIVGTLANGKEVVILLPKVQIDSGVMMAFKTGAFEGTPIKIKVFDLLSSDSNYAMFSTISPSGGASKALLLT